MAETARILIVDDNVNTRMTLTDLLTEDGYEVITAADGEEALAKVQKAKPSVVLMDIRLPGSDGYEVCRQIKQRQGPTAKVILYTAYINAINATKAKAVGADDILGKSSDFSNMRNAIRDLV